MKSLILHHNPCRIQSTMKSYDISSLNIQPSENVVESLDDILLVADRIGEGAFADVYKCKIKDKRYAVKCIQKRTLTDYQRGQLLNEIQILQIVNHPMMIDLVHVLQDSEVIHIFTELLVCGDLFDYMRTTTLDESQIVFYTTNVVLMFEHLHTNDIIYRDLKAENLVLMENGYLKLIDFGFAKRIKPTEKNIYNLGNSRIHCSRNHDGSGVFLSGRLVDSWNIRFRHNV